MYPVKNSFSTLAALPKLFDDFFARDYSNWNLDNFSSQGSTLPAVNVKETGDTYIVEMAAPGLRREDFRIELDHDVLKISVEHREENERQENERFTQREFSYQSFQRTFRLAKQVIDDGRIEARYDNGVLRIVLPKKEEAKRLPARTIEIQ
jgi:HSP20 family protein